MNDQWTIIVVRLPAEPSRHRVAVWRELRRIGALLLGQGVWALPAAPAFAKGLRRAVELAGRGNGEVLLLDAGGHDERHVQALRALFNQAREAEWREFASECDKFDAEIAREVEKRKFTLAELDEEEQSLDRLRRWYRELRVRDTFGAPSAGAAEQRLKQSAARFEDFAERVYQAIHGTGSGASPQ